MHAPVALPFFCVALVHLVGAKLDSGVKVFGSTYAAERPHKQIYTPKSSFSGPRSLSHAPTMSVLLEQCQPGRRSFRLEIGPLTQWNRPFFLQFTGILEDSHKSGAGNRRELISKR